MSDTLSGSDNRQHTRAPAALVVSYRTAGAFLVAYSVNLSKGGVFLEAAPLPIGTAVQLELEVPGTGRLEVAGVVAWTRPAAGSDPPGMGIRFSRPLDEEYGQAIDRLVAGFVGLNALVVGSPERCALLGRYVSSIVACSIAETDSIADATAALAGGIDLVLVDLVSEGEIGRAIAARALSAPRPTPVIALGGEAAEIQWARDAGVLLVRDPPTVAALQQAVIAALAKPMR